MLALSELGSSAPELLQAGWPIRYWLPAPSGYEALLQPLATALGCCAWLPWERRSKRMISS